VDTATNRLTLVDGAPMSYDPAGNQINDGSGPRTYDAENRMLTATNGAVSSSYAYDADGLRVRRIISGLETWQIYGIGGELLAEYAAGGASNMPQKEYGYRNGQLLVVWDGGETGDRQLQWLVQDHLGSTRMVVDRSGSLGGVRRHDFAPFGEELSAGVGIRGASNGYVADSTRQKFTGKEHDTETGLDFFEARYFASVQGRFTSTDPLNIPGLQQLKPKQFVAIIANPANWNQYVYAHNNPLNKIDPDGLLTIIIPGTWNNHEEWANSKFRELVEKTFNEKAIVLNNNGMGDSAEARAAAAEQLKELIENHEFAPGEKLNIVAHSHGGNAVAEAQKEGLSHTIDTLVTLGTPIRGDYKFDESKIRQHLNVYSKLDYVQKAGGERITVDMPLPSPAGLPMIVPVPVLIPGKRTIDDPRVDNLNATRHAIGLNSHSELWQKPGTWTKVVEPKIRK
jgi:RHS repeat-associated protein